MTCDDAKILARTGWNLGLPLDVWLELWLDNDMSNTDTDTLTDEEFTHLLEDNESGWNRLRRLEEER